MDYNRMTAPCGLDCFNCPLHTAAENSDAMTQVKQWSKEFGVPVEVMKCRGCRNHNGKIPAQLYLNGEAHHCAVYECTKKKRHRNCGECDDFPCDHLHPYADRASEVPHNTKVFNLCLIKKLGLRKWSEFKASDVRYTYFTKPWRLS